MRVTPGTPAVVTSGGAAGASQVALPGSTPAKATAAVNTAVVLTLAALANNSYRLTFLVVSYSAAPTGGNVQVAIGGTTIFDADIIAGGVTIIPIPDGGLAGADNQSVVITLAAAGAAVVGKVNAATYTEG